MTTVTGYLTNTDPAWARRSWQGEPALAVDFGAQEATGRTCVTDAKAATGVVHVTLDVPEEPHPLEGWHTGWRRPPWPGPCARPTRVDDLDLPRARQERQALAHGRWPWPCAGCAAGMVEASKQFRRGDGHLHVPLDPDGDLPAKRDAAGQGRRGQAAAHRQGSRGHHVVEANVAYPTD